MTTSLKKKLNWLSHSRRKLALIFLSTASRNEMTWCNTSVNYWMDLFLLRTAGFKAMVLGK